MTKPSTVKHFKVRSFACSRCHDRFEFDTDSNGTLVMHCSCSGWRKSILPKPMPVNQRKTQRTRNRSVQI